MTTEIVARLAGGRNEVKRDQATYRVLCGSPDCGEQIAKLNVGDWVRTYTGERPSPLVFSPGWMEGDDFIWRLTNHALKKLQRERRIASDWENGSGPVTQARKRLRTGTATSIALSTNSVGMRHNGNLTPYRREPGQTTLARPGSSSTSSMWPSLGGWRRLKNGIVWHGNCSRRPLSQTKQP